MSQVLLLLSSCLVLFICASAQQSCKGRCGESYFRGNDCQCDYECLSHNECCRNFESECTTRGSCKGRCGEKFKRGRQCHCDVQCLKYNQCCPDYESQCVIADYSMEEEPEEQEKTPTEEDMANEDFYGSETRDTEGAVSGNDFLPLVTPPTDRSVLVETTPGGTTPGGTTPGGTTPGGTTPGGTTTDGTTPGGTTTDGTTPDGTTPGGTTPGKTTPGKTTPGGTTPGGTTPGGTTPGGTTPGGTTPGGTTPGGTTPGGTTPGGTTPGGTSPGETTPGETTPGETTPGETTPGETSPSRTEEATEQTTDSKTPSTSATTLHPEANGTGPVTTPATTGSDLNTGSTPDSMTTTAPSASSEMVPQPTDTTSQSTSGGVSTSPTSETGETTPSVKTHSTTPLPNKVPEKPSKPKEPSNGLNENSYDVQSDANYDPNLCSGNPVNGLTTLRNGTVMVFRGHFFWVLDSRRQPGQAQSIKDVWGIPSPIDTVFTRCNCLGKTYFFKGGKYWRFENDIMDIGFPKLISDGFGLRGHISAALSMPKYRSRKESVFFFKTGGHAQRYTYRVTPTCQSKSPVMRRRRAAEPELGPEISLKTLRGFPSSVTSAISVPSAGRDEYKYYIFSQTKYYNLKMEGDTPLVLTPRAGPEKQKPAKSWFRCPKK